MSVIFHRTTFGKKKKQARVINALHTTSSTVVEGWSLGLFCSHRRWEPCSHWFDHELLFINISINIHMRPSVQKLRHGWNWVMLQDNKSSSKSKPEWLKKKKKNQGVATDHWRYRPQLGWNAVTGLKRAVHKQVSANLKELKQHCKEDWPKFLYNNVGDWQSWKQFLQVIAAKGASRSYWILDCFRVFCRTAKSLRAHVKNKVFSHDYANCFGTLAILKACC